MGDDQGGTAQGDPYLGKEHQQRKAHDDFRDQDGQVQQAVDQQFAAVLVVVEGQGGQGAHDRGDYGGDGSNQQAVAQGFQDPVIVEQGNVPFESKSGPHCIDPGIVEGIQGKDQERQVQKGQDDQGISH